jgi:hypothetical protein
MKEHIYFRNAAGQLAAWSRTSIRDLQLTTSAGAAKPADEKFLEELVASHPDLLGIAGSDDDTDIEGPFRPFTQLPLRALNGRTIAPDLVLFSRSGHIVVVEVKLSDNAELRDRQVVAQLLEYAASFTRCTENECLALFGGKGCQATTWAGFIQSLFPDAPERLARRFLEKLRTGKLHLVIACDEAPRGLRELVRGVVGQHALGEYDFRVVEIAPYVAEGAMGPEVIFLPHTVLKTEIVSRSSVTVSVPEGQAPPNVTVNVTPIEEAQRLINEPLARKIWTVQDLEEAYRTLPDQRLSQRLLRLLRWAVERNCLVTRETANPVFGLKSVTGRRIISFAVWKPFTYPAPDNFASLDARDGFVRDLQAVGLYAPEFVATASPNGKNADRELTDLTDEEFEQLLKSLDKYCGDASKASVMN